MTGTGKFTGAALAETAPSGRLNNAISGSGALTIEGRNKQIWNIGATNSSFSGGLALAALDRYEVRFNAAGSAGTGNVTVTPRTADGRSAVIVLGANNVFASTATLTLNGKGGDSSRLAYTGVTGVAIDMKTFNATVNKLYVLGVQMPNGNYTGGSGTWITGTGTLTVGGGVTQHRAGGHCPKREHGRRHRQGNHLGRYGCRWKFADLCHRHSTCARHAQRHPAECDLHSCR